MDNLKTELVQHIEKLKENTADDNQVKKLDAMAEHISNIDFSSVSSDKSKYYKKIKEGMTFFDKFKISLESNIDIDPGRILGLSDGIFGMVMTLLVFCMALPNVQLFTTNDFISYIQSNIQVFGYTLVSFILVSSFWIYYHEFIKINDLNMPYLWLNILFLGCISFIPFTTSLIGTYSHFFYSEVIFGLNILVTIISFMLMVSYAHKRGFLIKKLSKNEEKYINNTFSMIMGLTVIVNLLDFNVSSNFIYLFLLVPVISTLRDINFKMKS